MERMRDTSLLPCFALGLKSHSFAMRSHSVPGSSSSSSATNCFSAVLREKSTMIPTVNKIQFFFMKGFLRRTKLQVTVLLVTIKSDTALLPKRPGRHFLSHKERDGEGVGQELAQKTAQSLFVMSVESGGSIHPKRISRRSFNGRVRKARMDKRTTHH
ncbi:hypothetical protein NQ318_011685 [Aromia moschata]|uniref:Uncharacterized protein n=1 Tax=Aromia moschata TaxID=1265417 RepID=A0AAV8XJ92_9CUCU|nr:hypothetical protein NQ318_011685 [Aromia moschata]